MIKQMQPAALWKTIKVTRYKVRYDLLLLNWVRRYSLLLFDRPRATRFGTTCRWPEWAVQCSCWAVLRAWLLWCPRSLGQQKVCAKATKAPLFEIRAPLPQTGVQAAYTATSACACIRAPACPPGAAAAVARALGPPALRGRTWA